MAPVEIFQPKTEDQLMKGYDIIKSLYAGYFNDGLTLESYQKELQNALKDSNLYIYFAKLENQNVVGAIIFRSMPFIFSGEAFWIHSLIVNKEYRKQGIGTKLFQTCQKKAKELGLKQIYFNSATEDLNPDYAGTNLFHEKRGSRKIGVFFVNEV